jgi:flagellar protein FlbD
MIQLTRLNNARLAVNPDLIKYVEQAGDTVITLLNGEKLVVRESAAEVVERFLKFRLSLCTGSCPVRWQTAEESGQASSDSSKDPLIEEPNLG